MERRYQYLPQITFQLHAPLGALEFSPDGQFLAAGMNRLLRIWDLDSKDLPTSYLEYYAHEEASITTLLWTGVGLFSAYSSGEIALLSFHEDGEGGTLCHCHGFQASIKSINHVALDEATLNLAIAAEDGIIIQKPTGRKDTQWSKNCTLPQPRGVRLLEVAEVTSLAWLPASDHSLLVSYLRYGILIWDIEKKEPIRSLSPGLVPHGFLSPDGLYFALSNERNVFDLFDVKKHAHIHSFIEMANLNHLLIATTSGTPFRYPLTFVHEGRCLLGGGKGKIKMWRLDTKDCIVTLELEQPDQIQLLTAHTGMTSRHFRIAAGYNGGVTIWAADVSDLITARNSAEALRLRDTAARVIPMYTLFSLVILTIAVVVYLSL